MFSSIKNQLTQGFWKIAATVIVLLLAGPEILISMELMAMVEVLGASTFVIAYFSAFKLYFEKPLNWIKRFEVYSFFFIPSKMHLKAMPSLIIHAIPERISMIAVVSFYTISITAMMVSFA